jgi:hypothetical protein
VRRRARAPSHTHIHTPCGELCAPPRWNAKNPKRRSSVCEHSRRLREPLTTGLISSVSAQVDRDGPNGAAVVFNKNASLSLDHQRQRLPIAASEQAILHLVERHSTVIIIGHTGCGKTTQIPQVRAGPLSISKRRKEGGVYRHASDATAIFRMRSSTASWLLLVCNERHIRPPHSSSALSPLTSPRYWALPEAPNSRWHSASPNLRLMVILDALPVGALRNVSVPGSVSLV